MSLAWALLRRFWRPIASGAGLLLLVLSNMFLRRKVEAQEEEIGDLRTKERIDAAHQAIDDAHAKRQMEVGGAANAEDFNRLWGARGRGERVHPPRDR